MDVESMSPSEVDKVEAGRVKAKSGRKRKGKKTRYSASQWCNVVRSSKCFVQGRKCAFVHIDEYAKLSAAEREELAMPSLIKRHCSVLRIGLLLDMFSYMQVHATTYQEVAMRLFDLGWGAVPSHDDVVTLIEVIVSNLHHSIEHVPEINFTTLLALEQILLPVVAPVESMSPSEVDKVEAGRVKAKSGRKRKGQKARYSASKWCNMVRSSKCVVLGKCPFMHIEKYAKLSAAEREELAMPSLIKRHCSVLRIGLLLDMFSCIQVHATTYQEVAMRLFDLGWGALVPSHDDVVTLIEVIVSNLHYSIEHVPEINFTILLALEQILLPVVAPVESMSPSEVDKVEAGRVKAKSGRKKTDDSPSATWCNMVRSSKCVVPGRKCCFIHIDEYAKLSAAEREELAMPSKLMVKHSNVLRMGLLLDMSFCMQVHATTYQEVAVRLFDLGCDALVPSHDDVVRLIEVIVSNLHHSIKHVPEINFTTLLALEQILLPVAHLWKLADAVPEEYMQLHARIYERKLWHESTLAPYVISCPRFPHKNSSGRAEKTRTKRRGQHCGVTPDTATLLDQFIKKSKTMIPPEFRGKWGGTSDTVLSIYGNPQEKKNNKTLEKQTSMRPGQITDNLTTHAERK